MPLRIPTGGEADVPVRNGIYVPWASLSRAPTSQADPWAQHVTEPHDEYGVSGDWLVTETVDGEVCFDISELDDGDYIKVSGETRDGKEHAFYVIENRLRAAVHVERVSYKTVKDAVEETAEEAAEPDAAVAEAAENPDVEPEVGDASALIGEVRDHRDALLALSETDEAEDLGVVFDLRGAANNLDQALDKQGE